MDSWIMFVDDYERSLEEKKEKSKKAKRMVIRRRYKN